ncbi:hypothetical protein JCGZ_13237 [Jatropha curcas]|uniref:Uncharacterized protein n=1 Tax=Jatropha curcas TaxID=180498 RepID=A0A067K892_JATCU|nr:hypothetical protein JCGZ_13237 [Jatropha curcas]
MNSPAQNPLEVALISNELNKCSEANDGLIAANHKCLHGEGHWKKIDVMDSPVNQSPASKSSAKGENESSSKCAKELRGQPPRSPSGDTDSDHALAEESYQPPH